VPVNFTNPGNFDFNIPLSTPFLYNPALGNLLMDVVMHSATDLPPAVLYLRLIQTILNLAAFTTLDLLVPPRVQILGLLLVLLVPPRYRIRVQQSYCSVLALPRLLAFVELPNR